MEVALMALLLVLGRGSQTRSPLVERTGELQLMMRSAEVLYRYSFYGGFWLRVAERLGTPMPQAFKLNSKSLA